MTVTKALTYKVNGELAYLTEGWADGLADALRENQPKRMELVGDWKDLHSFSGLVECVENLRIAGTIENGKITSISGIEVFKNLRSIALVSKVKAGYDMTALRHLEKCDVAWQPDVRSLLSLSTLSDATLHAFPDPDLRAIPKQTRIARLRLGQPAISSLFGVRELEHVRNIELSRARKLTTLDGLEHSGVQSIEINEARQLVDLTALEKSEITELKLINVSAQIDLGSLVKLSHLRRIHVAGKGVPTLPWKELVSTSSLRWIAGLWDPEDISEAAIRAAVVPSKRITRFDTVGIKGVRPLWIELE